MNPSCICNHRSQSLDRFTFPDFRCDQKSEFYQRNGLLIRNQRSFQTMALKPCIQAFFVFNIYFFFSVLFKGTFLQNISKTHPHQLSDFPLGEREEILRLLAMLYEWNQRNEEQFDCRHGERDIFPSLPELQTTSTHRKRRLSVRSLVD